MLSPMKALKYIVPAMILLLADAIPVEPHSTTAHRQEGINEQEHASKVNYQWTSGIQPSLQMTYPLQQLHMRIKTLQS